jgi:hypothetical protein
MKKELKEKWIEALLSGKYAQTSGTLRRTESGGNGQTGFCCLGVFCDIVDPTRWVEDSDTMGYRHLNDLTSNRGYPPQDILELGLLGSQGNLLTYVRVGSMNDNGQSFKQIAEWIKENVPEE